MTHEYGRNSKNKNYNVYSLLCDIKTFPLVREWKKLNYLYESTTYINQYGQKNREELNGKY